MHSNEQLLKNPLRTLGFKTDDILPQGGFGAVLAHAGVGKTSFLVQIALNTMLRDENVLHISLDHPVDKICLWYKEVFTNLMRKYDIKKARPLWESALPHRFIMTFKVDGFSVPRLEERLDDLIKQNIFLPKMLFIDGFPFEQQPRAVLTDLKALAQKHALHVWFTMRTHRDEKLPENGIPMPLAEVHDLFDVAILLDPRQKEVHIKAIKGTAASIPGESQPETDPELKINPSTMLIGG